MRSRAGGMVVMVDAVFCMIAILVILIVVIPREPSLEGFHPQADLVLRCGGDSPRDLSLIVQTPAAAPVTTPFERRGKARVAALRAALEGALEGFTDTAANVRLISGGAQFLICHDLFHCAFTPGGLCVIPGIEQWAPAPGRQITFQYSYVEVHGNG